MMRLDPRRRRWLGATVVAAVLASASAAPLHAQTTDGFLLGAPQGTFTLRGGFAKARANSDLFTDLTETFTLKRSDFSGGSIGGEFAVPLGSNLELTTDLGAMWSNSPSHYRAFTDNADREIEQTTQLVRVPLTMNARLFLTPPGRSIGKFAWIPNTITPWVGGGAGLMWYRLRQQGDFIDFQTNAIREDDVLESSGWTPMVQGMAGADLSLTPRLALTGDARYLWAKRPALSNDFFEGYQPLDLSGVALTLGLTVRF
jgi:opacity protein-like surface antigen